MLIERDTIMRKERGIHMFKKMTAAVFATLCCLAAFNVDAFADVSGKSLIRFETVPAPSLEKNLLGDPSTRDIAVYLPPSYFSSKKHFPVVYYLHGYYDTHNRFVDYLPAITAEMKKGRLREYIIVVPDCLNRMMGSFYVNSPVTGNWETFITVDLVSYIDKTYRTIPSAGSRGIAGFSMGGFGTVNLALRHPDIYSVMFAISPGLFAPDGLKEALSCGLWDLSFKQAYGAAFAPDPSIEDPFAGIPEDGSSAHDKDILKKWENGFGNLKSRLDDYLAKKDKLRAIRIDYGRSDMYPWIINGCKYFSELLTSKGIAHEFHPFEGGHDIYENTAVKELAPFFSRNLIFE